MEGVVFNLQGHVRHNWKTRKFILCTEPTMLFYCRPSKVKNVMLFLLSLLAEVVVDSQVVSGTSVLHVVCFVS